MSMDLAFWKYKKGIYCDNQEVYKKACCDGEEMDALELLPIEEIKSKIAFNFRDWTALDCDNYEKDGYGAFSIFTTSQIARFDCYGLNVNNMNLMIDIMLEYGCPLYDPQILERFDEQN